MGFKFNKRFSILPGINLSVGKKSSSVSLGVKGAGINLSAKGVKSHLSAVGTGLSFEKEFRWTRLRAWFRGLLK